MKIQPGTVFNTLVETGCVAIEEPDTYTGMFNAEAPDGVICSYNVVMVCGYGHKDHQHVPHTCKNTEV